MDTMARGLRSAARLMKDGTFDQMIAERYKGFSSGIGKRFAEGKASLADLAAVAEKETKEPPPPSGRQERFESVFNAFAYK